MSSYDVIEVVLASAVADAGTFTVDYPDNRNGGHYENASNHSFFAVGYGQFTALAGTAAFSFGTSEITVTNNSGATLAAGTKVWVQADRFGLDTGAPMLANPDRMAFVHTTRISLGAPDVADPNGICEAQSDTGAHSLSLDGALVSGGVATLDVPRNIVVDSGGADTAVLTITGTDEYGATVVENITLDGTTAVAGKKAFKTVTGVTSSATIANAAFVGTGDVFGLPVFVPTLGILTTELEDGADASAGTLVAGVTTTATATTGDVRGTYDPNSAADGAKSFDLILELDDPSFKGVPQFAG